MRLPDRRAAKQQARLSLAQRCHPRGSAPDPWERALPVRSWVQVLGEVTQNDESVADSCVPILIEAYEQAISQAVDHVYDTVFMALFPRSGWLMALFPRSGWLDTRPKMREHGLRGLEDASFAAVRGLARLSQISCHPIPEAPWETLVSEIREDGDSPDPVDEAMRFFGPKSRMPLIGQEGTHWLTWI
jgi:hypothetical protein